MQNLYEEFEKFWDEKWQNVQLIPEQTFAKKVIYYFPKWETKKLLDVWAGSGRDSLFFAKNNFWVDAFDFSQNALEKLETFAKQENVEIKTIKWNIQDFDFWENHYDIIYACNSLHYFSTRDTQKIFSNLKKSLKKGWYLFLRVKSVDDMNYWKWEKLEENFYKNGWDIKYYFTKQWVANLFKDFEIVEISANSDQHNQISWEISINWFIDVIAKK